MLKLIKIFLFIVFMLFLLFLLFITFFGQGQSYVSNPINIEANLELKNKQLYLSGDILVEKTISGSGLNIIDDSYKVFYSDLNNLDNIYYTNTGSYTYTLDGDKVKIGLTNGMFFFDFNDSSKTHEIKLNVLKKQKDIDNVNEELKKLEISHKAGDIDDNVYDLKKEGLNKSKKQFEKESINTNLNILGTGKLFIIVSDKLSTIFSISSTIRIDFVYDKNGDIGVNNYFMFPYDRIELKYNLVKNVKENDFSKLKNDFRSKYYPGKILSKDKNNNLNLLIGKYGAKFVELVMKYIKNNNIYSIKDLDVIEKYEFSGKKYLESKLIPFLEETKFSYLFNKEKKISYYKVLILNSIIDLYKNEEDISLDEIKKEIKNINKKMILLKKISKKDYDKLNSIIDYYYYTLSLTYNNEKLQKLEKFLNLHLLLKNNINKLKWKTITLYTTLTNIFDNYNFTDYRNFKQDYSDYIKKFILFYKTKNNFLSELSTSLGDTNINKANLSRTDLSRLDYSHKNLGEAFLNNLNNYSEHYLFEKGTKNITFDLNIIFYYLEFSKKIYFNSYANNIFIRTGLQNNKKILEKIENYLFGCTTKDKKRVCIGEVLNQITDYKKFNDGEECLTTISKNSFNNEDVKILGNIIDGFKKVYLDSLSKLNISKEELGKIEGETIYKDGLYKISYKRIFSNFEIYLLALGNYNIYSDRFCSFKKDTGIIIKNEKKEEFGPKDIFIFLSEYRGVKPDFNSIINKGNNIFKILNFEIRDGNRSIIISFDINERYIISNIKLISSKGIDVTKNHIFGLNRSLNLLKDKKDKEKLYENADSKNKDIYDFRNFFRKNFLFVEYKKLNIKNENKNKNQPILNEKCSQASQIIISINDNLVGSRGLFYKYKNFLNIKLENVCYEVNSNKELSKTSIFDSILKISIKRQNYSSIFSGEFKQDKNKKIYFGEGDPMKIVVSTLEQGKYIKQLDGTPIIISEQVYLENIKGYFEKFFESFGEIERIYDILRTYNNNNLIEIKKEGSRGINFYTIISGQNVKVVLYKSKIALLQFNGLNNLVRGKDIEYYNLKELLDKYF